VQLSIRFSVSQIITRPLESVSVFPFASNVTAAAVPFVVTFVSRFAASYAYELLVVADPLAGVTVSLFVSLFPIASKL
jgi:hypothetical protein